MANDSHDYLSRHDYDLVHCFGAVSVYEFHPLFARLPNVITPYESHALYLESAARSGAAERAPAPAHRAPISKLSCLHPTIGRGHLCCGPDAVLRQVAAGPED